MNTKPRVHDRHTKVSQKKISLKKVVLALFLLILTLTPLVIYVVSATKEQPQPEEKYYPVNEGVEYIPDELIVKFKEGYEPDKLNVKVRERELSRESMVGQAVIQRDNIVYALTAQKTPEERKAIVEQMFKDLDVVGYEKVSEVEDSIVERYYTLMFPQGSDLDKKQEQLAEYKAIDFTEPNYEAELFQSTTPNDPRFDEMWALEMINARGAWEATTGDKSVTVAVVDSGVDYNHIDLAENIIDGGINAVSNNDDPMDDHDLGHGTHVAGTIGALSNNSEGISGVNWNISILPIKACKPDRNCPTAYLLDGLAYAVSSGVSVINLSLGEENPCRERTGYRNLIQEALDKNITVVAAAGNKGDDAINTTPASCPGVITVGSVDRDENRPTYSNYGSVVDIAAPGGELCNAGTCTTENSILSTKPNNIYRPESGTSMAAPHVTGAAALLLSLDDSLTPERIRECLVEGADTITTDRPIGPRLNISGALAACGFTDGAQNDQSQQGNYYVDGIVYLDSNENSTRDDGEPGVEGATTILTGPRTYTKQTDTGGSFMFPDIEQGQYELALTVNGNEVVTLNFSISDTNPIRSPEIPVTQDELNQEATDSPDNSSNPIGIPGEFNFPQGQESNSTPTNTPTPTPFEFYDCEEVTENITRNGRQIQISYLECTPS